MTAPNLDTIERLVMDLPETQRQELATAPGIRERIGATCKLTPRQQEAEALLRSPASHCMLFGGGRSGKTFIILRNIVGRALTCPSRHCILRLHFTSVIKSVGMDTLPKVMELCYPGAIAGSHLDRSHWVYVLPNGSELWLGGLDDKERTEKVLGSEYASIFLNECSQIPLSSRDIALTRLAQNTPLPLKMFYDCNPPSI